ncbi:STM3941 family protein [Flavobacterium sp.]|jgi:hypothetical protein|uniref:STM3941 family protein n=1 Tax=Flavobacterium sp. TaxID=239 RepID=UPI0022C01775|nr:STM3941 family protein [Flavobacterium sp.]MCZ8145368.1 hypothetical protein [Flavobacterium sp.]
MKTIIINKNRNYFRAITVILLILFVLYFLVFKFLRYPTEHTYFLLPTKNTVVIFSVVGILTCILVLFIFIKNIFNRNAHLKIDNHGIYNGFSFFKKKFIKWEEINSIEAIRYNNNNYIAIFLKDTSNTEKGLNYLFFKLNQISMGTPYVIFAGDLDCSFSELKRLIFEVIAKEKNIKTSVSRSPTK